MYLGRALCCSHVATGFERPENGLELAKDLARRAWERGASCAPRPTIAALFAHLRLSILELAQQSNCASSGDAMYLKHTRKPAVQAGKWPSSLSSGQQTSNAVVLAEVLRRIGGSAVKLAQHRSAPMSFAKRQPAA